MCMTASLHLEIVKACLGIVVITAIAERINIRKCSAAAYYLAPRVIICFLIYTAHAALSNIINTDAKLTKSKKKTRKP